MSIHKTIPAPALALWLVERAPEAGTLIHIAEDDAFLLSLEAAAQVFADGAVDVLALPPWDSLPYDRTPPSAAVIGRRVRTLEALSRPAQRPRLLLTTADAVLQRVPPPSSWEGSAMWLEAGQPLDLDALRTSLAERGYELDERVDEPGEVALRGQVIDLFPAGDPCPVRITIAADGTIATIQPYDPATQRTTGDIDRIALHRCTEFPLDPEDLEQAAEALANPEAVEEDDEEPESETLDITDLPFHFVSLFDTLGTFAAVLTVGVKERWTAFAEQTDDAYAATLRASRVQGRSGVPPRPARLYLTPAQASRAVNARVVENTAEADAVETPRRVDTLASVAREAADRGDRAVIATPIDPEKVAASLRRRGVEASMIERWAAAAPGQVSVIRLDVDQGFARPGLMLLPTNAVLRTRVAPNLGAGRRCAADRGYGGPPGPRRDPIDRPDRDRSGGPNGRAGSAGIRGWGRVAGAHKRVGPRLALRRHDRRAGPHGR